MSLQALNDQIAQAKAAAAAAVPANVAPVGVAPAPVLPGRAVSLSEILTQTGMQVKAYLKVDKSGFYIGADTTTLFEEVAVEFRLSDVTAFYGLRYGDPAKYLRSYDRMVEARSKRAWADQIAEAQRLDSRVRGDYPAVDVPFYALTDLKTKKGDLLISSGEKLGWTSSVTNFKEFADFARPYEQVQSAGGLSPTALLRGKIVHAQRKNASNVWGALTFVDFVIADNGESAAEAA